jgi:hypothetical protein
MLNFICGKSLRGYTGLATPLSLCLDAFRTLTHPRPIMKRLQLFVILAFVSCQSLWAAEHRVEVLKEAPPADGLSDEVAKQLDSTGMRVIRGTTREVCDIWLCKQWTVKDGFESTAEVNYPFQMAQMVGVIRYPRKGADFRDQDIDSGVYTLRYAQQPVDGAHVGTSPTRDFFVLIAADNDEAAAAMEPEQLIGKSAEAAGSAHPAMLCLQRVRDPKADAPSIRHNEEHDWWIVRGQGTTAAGEKKTPLPFELVIVGVAAE